MFGLSRPFAPGLEDLAEQPIVPRHVWVEIADPLAWNNPDPVATGPYTEVVTFTSQVWELGRNPRYWQPGKPAVAKLRLPAFARNDAANLALVNGEVDWAGNLVPAVGRTFVDRDRAHHVAWSPPVEATVYLYANTTVAPFSDRRVREALSLAIARETLVTVAMDGLTHPADATGLSDALAGFRDPGVRAPWTDHDPAAAARILEAAGLPLVEGARTEPVDLLVVAGWSDWIRAAQRVARDLGAVGVPVRVRPVDFGGWLDRVKRGDFALTIGWSSQGSTPYAGYRDLIGSGTVRPVGEASGGNWHRYGSPAADALLARIEATADPDAQVPPLRSAPGPVRRGAARHPAVPRPGLGRREHAPVHRLPLPRRPLGDPLPEPPARAAAKAWRGGVLDTVVGPALTLLGAFPYFWLAMGALHVFGFGLGWFPLRHAWDTSVAPAPTLEFGWGVVRHAALPALTLVGASVGGWMLGMRTSARSILATDQVLLARARGLPTARVVSAYVLRNAVLPHLTGFGMALGFVVSGALLTEVVFSYPGEGWLLVQAVRAQDYPLLQGLVLAITLAVLAANALVDVLTLLVDPRTRAA